MPSDSINLSTTVRIALARGMPEDSRNKDPRLGDDSNTWNLIAELRFEGGQKPTENSA